MDDKPKRKHTSNEDLDFWIYILVSQRPRSVAELVRITGSCAARIRERLASDFKFSEVGKGPGNSKLWGPYVKPTRRPAKPRCRWPNWGYPYSEKVEIDWYLSDAQLTHLSILIPDYDWWAGDWY